MRSHGGRRGGYEVRPFPWFRRLVVDAGRAGSHRHSTYGLIEIDITDARVRMRELHESTGERVSMTAWLTTCLARTIAEDRSVQAFRDIFGRLVIFDDVDVNVIVETTVPGQPFPMNHVVRGVDRRDVFDVQRELRRVKEKPSSSPSMRLARWARMFAGLPGFVRGPLLRVAPRFPKMYKELLGTTGVTAVGMFGAGGGWGISFQTHSLNLLVGGISRRPRVEGGRVVEREYLALTLMVDHDIVDGAPAARFAARLRARIESAEGLDPQTSPNDRSLSTDR